MTTTTVLVTKEAREEYLRLKNTRKAIVRPDGELAYSVWSEIVERTALAITSPIDPKYKGRSTRGKPHATT